LVKGDERETPSLAIRRTLNRYSISKVVTKVVSFIAEDFSMKSIVTISEPGSTFEKTHDLDKTSPGVVVAVSFRDTPDCEVIATITSFRDNRTILGRKLIQQFAFT
jgi:hypothetical protein